MSVELTPGPGGQEWYCPRDDAWFPASAWTVETEDEPGHRESWHNCPNRHGFPGGAPNARTETRVSHEGEDSDS